MIDQKNIPNPGSDEAIEAGCTCPIVDNFFGKGTQVENGIEFIYTMSCPVHPADTLGEKTELFDKVRYKKVKQNG